MTRGVHQFADAELHDPATYLDPYYNLKTSDTVG